MLDTIHSYYRPSVQARICSHKHAKSTGENTRRDFNTTDRRISHRDQCSTHRIPVPLATHSNHSRVNLLSPASYPGAISAIQPDSLPGAIDFSHAGAHAATPVKPDPAAPIKPDPVDSFAICDGDTFWCYSLSWSGQSDLRYIRRISRTTTDTLASCLPRTVFADTTSVPNSSRIDHPCIAISQPDGCSDVAPNTNSFAPDRNTPTVPLRVASPAANATATPG